MVEQLKVMPSIHPEVFVSKETEQLKTGFITDLEAVAPDLKSNSLAKHYAKTLFDQLTQNGAFTTEQIIEAGAHEFYLMGKDVLGPLAVSFVHTVLPHCRGMAIFPARDATPFYYIAKTLKALQPDAYPVVEANIINPVFNRKLWGIDDEQDVDCDVLPITHPLVQKLLSQMGFYSKKPKTFIEVGCWGSMIDQLNKAMAKGSMPKESFSVYFLYTHLPEYIYGFTNQMGAHVPQPVLETIADTWEAFPKYMKRPTKLVEKNGIVSADVNDKMIDSPLLYAWTSAALQGVVDAATEFVMHPHVIEPSQEIDRLWQLSMKAQQGVFTGVLPIHTETWTEGEAWIAQWQWGKIPPLV